MTPRKPPVPRGLDARGKALWADVIGKYELRVDELRVLEDACREADLIARIDGALSDAPLMVAGRYEGMTSVHPLIAEVRQHRRVFAQLARQLGLPDEPTSDVGKPRSVQARAAAHSRWQHSTS